MLPPSLPPVGSGRFFEVGGLWRESLFLFGSPGRIRTGDQPVNRGMADPADPATFPVQAYEIAERFRSFPSGTAREKMRKCPGGCG